MKEGYFIGENQSWVHVGIFSVQVKYKVSFSNLESSRKTMEQLIVIRQVQVDLRKLLGKSQVLDLFIKSLIK